MGLMGVFCYTLNMHEVSNSQEILSPDQDQRVIAEDLTASTVDYTLYRSERETGQTIVFYPGMACNRFGHGDHAKKEPKNAVADLVALAAGSYNLIFPEVHVPDTLGDSAPITGLTVDMQNQKVFEVLSDVGKRIELGRVTYIGQSLGSLAVAQIAELGGVAHRERAIFWGPPTLEGDEHREMLVSKFTHKPETSVDEEGNGQLQLGNGRLMYVSADYWRSLDENSLRIHHTAMGERYEAAAAICVSKDSFYPNNEEYLAKYAPSIQRLEIEGVNHMFRPEPMRAALKHFMCTILFGTEVA